MARIPASEREAFVQAKRHEIMAAAISLWAERGFDATSVEAIARAAGMSKGSLYLYFESKLALLEEVFRSYSLLPDVELMIANVREGSLEEVVRRFVRLAWQHLKERREVVGVLLRELPTHLDLAQHFAERLLLPANRLVASYLEARLGRERAAEISMLVAGRGLIGMLLMLFMSQELLGAGKLLPIEDDDIAKTISEIFLHGVCGTGEGET